MSGSSGAPRVLREGKVVQSRDLHVRVLIHAKSACSGCRVKDSCMAAETQEKIIDAISTEPLREGDLVIVSMEERLGRIAVFYGFLLPCIVMVTILFLLHAGGTNDIQSGLWAISSLVPYYVLLYAFRKKIEKDFIFRAEKR